MEKIKSFVGSDKGKDIITILIVILVGLGSFLLGRLSKQNDTDSLKIDYTSLPTEANIINGVGEQKTLNSSERDIKASESPSPKTGNFFASKRGKKYYSISCSAGKNIKLENRRYFNTREEAEQAGFEISDACR